MQVVRRIIILRKLPGEEVREPLSKKRERGESNLTFSFPFPGGPIWFPILFITVSYAPSHLMPPGVDKWERKPTLSL